MLDLRLIVACNMCLCHKLEPQLNRCFARFGRKDCIDCNMNKLFVACALLMILCLQTIPSLLVLGLGTDCGKQRLSITLYSHQTQVVKLCECTWQRLQALDVWPDDSNIRIRVLKMTRSFVSK